MKNKYAFLLLCAIQFIGLGAFAQLNLPRASPQAEVSQTIGLTNINIKYSRPSVNGRTIWGSVVPYGMNNLGFGTAKESPWRAGADENTTITFSTDVSVEGKFLKAGTYGLFMIINENNTATVIFSTKSKAWGSFYYTPADEALRVDVSTTDIAMTEQLTYDFINLQPNAATVVLNWEKKQIPFTVSIDLTALVLADIREQLENSPGFTRTSWEEAANFSLNNGGDLNEALMWINNAIAGQFYSQKTFNNLQIKAQILAKQGKTEEADKTMDEALSMANIFEVHNYGRLLIAQGQKEKAMEVFKMNAKNHKNLWPVNYGLARAYSAMGDYPTALKYLKKAEANAPDLPNKNAVKANIVKLEKGEDIN